MKTQSDFGNHLSNKIYSRAIQKFGSFRKFPHFRSLLSTIGIFLFSLNIIYRKHYHPASYRKSYHVKSKILYYKSSILFLLRQERHTSCFLKKVDFIERIKLPAQCCLLKNIWQLSFEAVAT